MFFKQMSNDYSVHSLQITNFSKISETNFLNFEKNRDFPDFKNFINFAISICVYDYSTLGD